ncbi:hypothetical protein [Deinococcus sp. AJ005]|uniref:glycosyl-4,4'-diaponeurosporenoate acyltransferase CrtO family protein n=1 Tax=Deinococcus sp. AJ005 TaxID=2652443 RepID=UPI00125CD18F|nr:hypothetical protein [Deinococcus sp. AJ005]QFP75322.1 hypothetical protein DAAJ005_01905 [Deinococcus sp. AJ005]
MLPVPAKLGGAALLVVLTAWGLSRVTGFHTLLFALGVQVLLMWWALYLLALTRPMLRGSFFTVGDWEVPFYKRLGAPVFANLLRWVGWERLRRDARGFGGTRASLARLDHATREAEYSHLLLALICLGLAVGALRLRAADTAGWLLLTTIPTHLYPVMLQRSLRWRLQRIGIKD